MPTRRAFLRDAATVAFGAGVLSSGAAADHPDEIAEHIDITYPESELRKYQPKLVIKPEDEEKYMAMRAWKVTSPEYQYDVLVYFNEYTHQDGASKYTSHAGDHEPIYLYLSEDGKIRQDRFSAYHWYAGGGTGPPTGTDGHPLYGVVSPWHNHYRTTDESQAQLMDLKPLGTKAGLQDPDTTTPFESWLANGLEADLAPVVTNPARMLTRPHWWKDEIGGVSLTAMRVAAAYISRQDGAAKVNPRNILPW